MYDIAIIGGGPAGLSAAITARARNKSVAIFTNEPANSPLWKAERVDNYPGVPGVSGARLIELMTEQAQAAGAEYHKARVANVMDTGESYFLNTGAEFFEAKAIIVATGVVSSASFPGEKELLGAGVSYCATCDGMLYRNKKAVVVGRSKDAPHEANALYDMGVQVSYTGLSPQRPEGLREEIDYLPARKIQITGGGRVEAISLDGESRPTDGVFILRETIAPTALLPQLELSGGFVAVDRNMKTNLERVYAAGDCTGKPLQIAKAVGEGLVAALSAVEALG